MRAITPTQAMERKHGSIPDAVFDAFNAEIVERFNFDAREARVTQNNVVARIEALTGVEREEIFDRRWLDVELIYETRGWRVSYVKGTLHGEAFFLFTATGFVADAPPSITKP